MKKLVFSFSFLMLSLLMVKAQTVATDFTVTDCTGGSHHLFAELDSGLVIVIAWVMPCGACKLPTQQAYNAAMSFQTTNPGRVKVYIADDYADTDCATITSWANGYAMTNSKKFSNAAVNMSDYGTGGMPKIVVLAGTGHGIYYNMNLYADGIGVQNAIDSAIATNPSTIGINESTIAVSQLNVSPNPVSNSAFISYSLNQATDVLIEVYNAIGERVKLITVGKQAAGKQSCQISFDDLPNGTYFAKLKNSLKSENIKFIISK